MPYSEFTLRDIRERFGIVVNERQNVFEGAPVAEVTPLLKQVLEENVPLALAISPFTSKIGPCEINSIQICKICLKYQHESNKIVLG